MQILFILKLQIIKNHDFRFFLALLLALIQGLTEFLPVSSSAHLLFPSLLFGAKDFGIVFDISVHAGTLAAVIYYFKKELLELVHAWTPWTQSRNKENFSLGLNLIVATLPIVLVGLIASDFAESRSANINSIAWANLTCLLDCYMLLLSLHANQNLWLS